MNPTEHKDPARLVGGPLRTERLPDGCRKLLSDLEVEVETETITVLEGTITDYSSIPWFGRMFFRWSQVDIAGVVHDRIYQTGSHSRARADTIWRLVAISGQHRAGEIPSWIGWAALRVGGWGAWQKWARRRALGEENRHQD